MMEFYPPLDINFNLDVNDRSIHKFFAYPILKQPEPQQQTKKIPNDTIVMNQSLKAPIYNYLNSKSDDQQGMNQIIQKSLDINALNSLRLDNIMNRTSVEPPKPIRKLGQIEKIFHGLNEKSRSYIYRASIVTSQIDLFKNIKIVNQAIQEWKNVNPLLRCRVIRVNTATDIKNNINYENFFAFATEEKQKSLDNIKFLYYKSNSSKTCDDVWKLLLEKETTLPIDGENDLLWRLTFLKLENSKASTDINFYCVLLTYVHSIMDGRSSYQSLLQLFALIEKIHSLGESHSKEEKLNIIPPSKEEIFRQRIPTKEVLMVHRYYLKAPSFLNAENAFKSSYQELKNLSKEEINNGVIYTIDNRAYTTVKELIEISKNSNSKFRTLLLNKKELEALMKKCKENKVKLTTFINMSLVLALRMIYSKHENFNTNRTVINWTTNVSLRQFPEYQNYLKNKPDSIGCYVGLSFSSFSEDLQFKEVDMKNMNEKDNGTEWITNFWKYCKRESVVFHDSLNKGNFIFPVHLPMKKKDNDEFFYHFGNSNLGIMPSSLTQNRLIRIRQVFATGRYSKENFLCWFSNLLATIDNQLCWTISFNSNKIPQELITQLIENLSKIIRTVSK